MTRAVRDRILKDANGNISDHLRNHIHLTNCIHLKNHIHKQSPILADRSLMRDLVALQRSRSLRDPSASPPSWRSPSVVEALLRRAEMDTVVNKGRWSMGTDRPLDSRRISGSSPPVTALPASRGAAIEISRQNEGPAAASDRSSRSGLRDRRRVGKEESSGRNLGIDAVSGNYELPEDGHDFIPGNVSGSLESRERTSKLKGKQRDDHPMTLSERLNELAMDSDDLASSHIRGLGRHAKTEKTNEGAGATRGHNGGRNRVKRHKFRGGRRPRASLGTRDVGAQNEMSVASNSLAQGAAHPIYDMEEGDEEYGQNVTRAPGNGCGIPWNWSRLHHRGKSILDMAGRSLSCGFSDSRLRRGDYVHRGRDVSVLPVMSDHSSSSRKSDAEALPLLVDGSHASTEHAAWVHDYSGELGIYADNLLKNEVDSDLASEARSREQHQSRGHRNGRHQNLTQKYMPRTFRDLVGQNLVAQALSNAVVKRKVGLLYVFYGPPGTGKTSCARIFARALNCQSLDHPKPCGFCDCCIAYDMGKIRNIKEIGAVSNFDFGSFMNLLDSMIVSKQPSQYRVFIFDDCDTLSPDSWNCLLKVIDRAPRRVVFILVSTSLDVLPHIIISRCQKFFFPKLKDADIIYSLQWIATKEELEIDKDALKLIATRSDGSLRDAEMTLEQLSLLGQRISVPLVQELVGLVSDEKLVDLLDLALSADTVNTVKNLREIMESGAEPLALMSQLATVITDILAGSYHLTREKPRRKFFRQQALSKEDMEKLRQALKTLSEAEKQLRVSNDRLTWLTAALLQLAPDQQYMLPSSADTSFNHSPLGLYNNGGRERSRKSNVERTEMPDSDRRKARTESFAAGRSGDYPYNSKLKSAATGAVPHQAYSVSSDKSRSKNGHFSHQMHKEIEEIWLNVLEKVQVNSIREFMYQEGKLISVTFGTAPTVQLMFTSHLTKSMAEKFRAYILEAFESVLGSPVTIEIRSESRKDSRGGKSTLPAFQEGTSATDAYPVHHHNKGMPLAGYDDINRNLRKDGDGSTQSHFESAGAGRNEIVEIESSPRERKSNEHVYDTSVLNRPNTGSGWARNEASAHKSNTVSSFQDESKNGDRNQNLSIVRGKVSLAHVIQQADGYAQHSGWSKRKAVSIAEKLEQENLRLEPRSRNLLCWKTSRIMRRKKSRLRIRTRKPRALLKYLSCGKCMSNRSPR